MVEEVLREFPPIGKYRIRLIRSKGEKVSLDVREYVDSETFEGFTRRGIRLASPSEMEALRDTLAAILEAKPAAEKA